MLTEEIWILILVGSFFTAAIMMVVMMLILHANDKHVNLFFSFHVIPDFIGLIRTKESIVTKFVFVAILLTLFGSAGMIPYSFPKTMMSNEDENCMYERRFKSWAINELITGKFIDSNHATPSFWVLYSFDSTSNAFPLNYHLQDLYDSAEPGDSLIKESNSMIITLGRDGNYIDFEIDYGCNEDNTASNNR